MKPSVPSTPRSRKAKKQHRRWGIFNYEILWAVARLRVECRKFGLDAFYTEDEFNKELKDGSIRIVKVIVEEV